MQGISYLLITSENYPAPYNKETPYFTSNSIIYRFFENFSNFILYIYIPYFMTYTNVCFIHKQKTRTFLHSIRKVLVVFMIFIPFIRRTAGKRKIEICFRIWFFFQIIVPPFIFKGHKSVTCHKAAQELAVFIFFF